MFKKARLKLTAFYLIIIMVVSVLFSFVIYRGIATDLDRRFEGMEIRLRDEVLAPLPFKMRHSFSLRNELRASKNRLLVILLYANGFILLISGGIGYLLAGRTLKPIEDVVEDQKRFIGDASHELRTPLTALKTSTEVALRDKKMTLEEARSVLISNLEDVDKLQSLTSFLLTSSKYESAGDGFESESFNLKEAIDGAYKKVSSLAKNKGITLRIDTKDIVIKANKISIEEMLVVFFDNAIKFTAKGGRVSLTTSSDNKYVYIKIKDTGVGIDRAHLPYIFNRFYKADKARSRDKSSGFGIGLSIAKRIVDLHNGVINIESVTGNGSVFTVKIPLKFS